MSHLHTFTRQEFPEIRGHLMWAQKNRIPHSPKLDLVFFHSQIRALICRSFYFFKMQAELRLLTMQIAHIIYLRPQGMIYVP